MNSRRDIATSSLKRRHRPAGGVLPEALGTRQPPRPAPALATHGPGSTRQDGTAAMALYGLIWLEIAFADNTSLPGAHPRRSARGSSNCWRTRANMGRCLRACWIYGGPCRGRNHSMSMRGHQGLRPRRRVSRDGVTSWGCRPRSAAPRSPRLDRVARSREHHGCLCPARPDQAGTALQCGGADVPPEEFKVTGRVQVIGRAHDTGRCEVVQR